MPKEKVKGGSQWESISRFLSDAAAMNQNCAEVMSKWAEVVRLHNRACHGGGVFTRKKSGHFPGQKAICAMPPVWLV
jgi:hypothetical protein